VQRLQPLMQSGYISRQEFAMLSWRWKPCAHAPARHAPNWRRRGSDAQHAQIRSPIAGHVGRISVRAGSLVQAGGEPLTTILAPGALDVRASVAQQDWPELAAAWRRAR